MQTIISKQFTSRLYLKVETTIFNSNKKAFFIRAYIKGTKEFVGRVRIEPWGFFGNSSNVGYSIVEEKYMKQGFMREIVNKIIPILKENNIQACCYAKNLASDKILSSIYTHTRTTKDGRKLVNCYSFDNWT